MEEYHHTVFGRFNLDGTTPSESGHRNVTIRSGRYLNETMTVIMETLPGNEDSLTGVVYGELSFPPEGLPRIRPLPQNTDPQVGTSLPAKQSPIFSLTGRCCGRHWSSPATYSMELQVDCQGTTVVIHGTQGLPKSYMNAMMKVDATFAFMGPDSNTLHLDARKVVFLAALSCYSAMTSALGPLFSPCQPPGGSIPSTVPPPPPGTPTGNSSKTLAFKTPRRPARAALQVPVSRLPTSNPSTNAADLKNLGSPIAIPADSGTPPDSPRRANKRTKSSSAPRRSNDGSRSPVDPPNTSPTLGFQHGTPSYAFPGQFVYPPPMFPSPYTPHHYYPQPYAPSPFYAPSFASQVGGSSPSVTGSQRPLTKKRTRRDDRGWTDDEVVRAGSSEEDTARARKKMKID